MDSEDCKKSKITCDKKCNGKASDIELDDGMYLIDITVKKGKVKIEKCQVQSSGQGTTSPIGGSEGSGEALECSCIEMKNGILPTVPGRF